MKKVLVTGSGGFILSNFLRKAIYEKHPYVFASIDKVTKTSAMNNIYSNRNHQFYIGDVTDRHFLDVIFELERPDVVIHGAAETFVDDSIKEPDKFITANVVGTQEIVNACLKWKTERLIYISTDEVYGQLGPDSDYSWVETDNLSPRNPYSASKAAGEHIVRASGATYGLNYNITRCSNNYGPRQTTEKLIPKVIKKIMQGEKIPVYGKGLQMRDWTHVFDNCAAMLKILESGMNNDTYNIGSNQDFSNIEVVQEICNVMGKGHDLISFVEDRPGHDFRYSVDSSKIKTLGWKPSIKFKQGIVQTVEWYLNNKWFLQL